MALPKRGLEQRAASGTVFDTWRRLDSGTVFRALVLILAAAWIYLPSMHGAMLWDDAGAIFENNLVLSPDGYWRAWIRLGPHGEHIPGDFYPLTLMSEWVEWRLFGTNTFGYHVVCVALHLASALLLWRLFARLRLELAWFGALIFVTHPIMVESVAWMSELKNTLALPPLLLAMLSWLEFEKRGKAQAYRAALLWFVLSLVVKTTGLMLPVVLLGRIAWKQGALTRRDALHVAPFFAISLAAGLLTLAPPDEMGAHAASPAGWSALGGWASAGWSILFLLGKCLVPVGLLPDYMSLGVASPTAFDLVPWVLLGILAALFAAAWKRAPWYRAAGMGLGYFAVNLFPVVIFVEKNYTNMYWSLDHLVYVPIIGLIGWIIAWLAEIRSRHSFGGRILAGAACAVVVVAYSVGGHLYTRVFTDPVNFWLYAVQREPGNWQTRSRLADMYRGERRFPEAIDQATTAVALNPASGEARYELAQVERESGDTERAEAALREAIQLDPKRLDARLDLADIERKAGHFDEAEGIVNDAIAAEPRAGAPYAIAASLRARRGDSAAALALYAKAAQLAPASSEIRYNYGVALLESGHPVEAVEQLRAAVDLNERFAPSRTNLGAALARTGALPEAIEQFQAAIAIDPAYVVGRNDLALALAQTGDMAGAIAQLEEAVKLDPTNAKSRDLLEKFQTAPGPATK